MSIYVNEVRPNVGAPPIVGSMEPSDDAPDLGAMTVAQLKALAKERGITVPRGATKAEIIELLEV